MAPATTVVTNGGVLELRFQSNDLVALQTPDGQKEQRPKQSRQKSGDSDSLWSGHAN